MEARKNNVRRFGKTRSPSHPPDIANIYIQRGKMHPALQSRLFAQPLALLPSHSHVQWSNWFASLFHTHFFCCNFYNNESVFIVACALSSSLFRSVTFVSHRQPQPAPSPALVLLYGFAPFSCSRSNTWLSLLSLIVFSNFALNFPLCKYV